MSSPSQKEIRTMKDFLDETEINLLECKVCFEKYSHQQRYRPRNLPCGHIMCQDCVSSLCNPGNSRLECPFCRKGCRKSETSVCLPVLHLLEIIGRVVPENQERQFTDCRSNQVAKLNSASFKLSASFGGWGVLFNPTGIASCYSTGCLLVAHDGKKRLSRFTLNGKLVHEMGEKSSSENGLLYAVSVAVTLDGFIAVTDAGDRSLKVYSQAGKCTLIVTKPFLLPWGLAVNAENEVIVSDPDANSLILVAADFSQGCIKKMVNICSYLSQPKEIAIYQANGSVIVVEHLAKDNKNSSSTRIKILNNKMKLLRQIDSFSLSSCLPLDVHTSGVAFDQEGNILVADVNNRCVICLNKVEKGNALKHVVASGLSYPVAIAVIEDGSIAVLDSGNHSVLVYSP
ncbi:PREDICTED: E3 ubiquitin-protein ligase NHLRC1 [Nanorana parkeri]|uniref:E3 ubiquitin-protein ligase NHLRC1 n=1 Tax=Nanorana parkeri TaxID=125878 RepID=UPI000854473D|nr:PREDICTED: E3 ubiquitin-protein ligase NHLRC1 [Nanorana parkeri]